MHGLLASLAAMEIGLSLANSLGPSYEPSSPPLFDGLASLGPSYGPPSTPLLSSLRQRT
jgi:hypothetical protein